MATSAAIGHGATFGIGNGAGPEVFTPIGEVTSITPPGFSRDTVDATHMASPDRWREFVGGLRDPGEVEIEFNFIPGATASDAIVAKFASDTVSNYNIVFPNAEVWIFAGLCTAFTSAVPLDDKMTATATFKLTGKPAFV